MEGLLYDKTTPYYSHTVHFFKNIFNIFHKRSVLYNVALRPAFRVAQSAVIGQHAHSVAIGRTLCACVGKFTPREVVDAAWCREAGLLHFSPAHCRV